MIQFSFHQNINGGHGRTDQLLSAYYPAPFFHQWSGHCLAWCVAGQDWKPRLWWYSWDNNELKPCMSPCPVETLVISIPISAYWPCTKLIHVCSQFESIHRPFCTPPAVHLALANHAWDDVYCKSCISISICTSSTKNPKLHWESYLFSMILTSIGRYTVVTAANTPFPTSKNNPSLNTNHAINIHKSRNDKSKRMQVMNDPTSNPP